MQRTHIFLVDKLNFWTLQYYRRLVCRSVECKLLTFDPAWKDYANCVILPADKLEKSVLPQNKTVLARKEEFYDIAELPVNISPNTSYTVRIKCSVIAGLSKKCVLSMNFFGADGQKDFDQVHIDLDTTAALRDYRVQLETGHFMSDEKISLRIWPMQSDPGVAVRIHQTQISQEQKILNMLDEHLTSDVAIDVHLPEERFLGVIEWLSKFNPVILGNTELYRFNSDVQNEITTNCFCADPFCSLIKRDGVSLTKVHSTSIQIGDRIIETSPEDDYRIGTTCLLRPMAFHSSPPNEMIYLAGDDNVVGSLKLKWPERFSQLHACHVTDEPPQCAVSVILDPLESPATRRFIIACWSRGIVTITFEQLPVYLKNGPIKSIFMTDLFDFVKNKSELQNLKELGHLAIQARLPKEILRDISSLAYNQL